MHSIIIIVSQGKEASVRFALHLMPEYPDAA
jgi:hypothetical protein